MGCPVVPSHHRDYFIFSGGIPTNLKKCDCYTGKKPKHFKFAKKLLLVLPVNAEINMSHQTGDESSTQKGRLGGEMLVPKRTTITKKQSTPSEHPPQEDMKKVVHLPRRKGPNPQLQLAKIGSSLTSTAQSKRLASFSCEGNNATKHHSIFLSQP